MKGWSGYGQENDHQGSEPQRHVRQGMRTEPLELLLGQPSGEFVTFRGRLGAVELRCKYDGEHRGQRMLRPWRAQQARSGKADAGDGFTRPWDGERLHTRSALPHARLESCVRPALHNDRKRPCLASRCSLARRCQIVQPSQRPHRRQCIAAFCQRISASQRSPHPATCFSRARAVCGSRRG